MDGMGDVSKHCAQTHMKPITATILIRENVNSASPYPFTPNMLMVTMVTRNTVTKMALVICPSQNPMVRDAAIISKGRMVSHCMA